MTTTATVPATRQARRLALLGLIRRASEELVELERADHRIGRLTEDVRPHIPTVTPSTADAAVIRAWARHTGYPVAPAGRLDEATRLAYAAALTAGYTPPPPPPRRDVPAADVPPADIRAWAIREGHTVPARGTIPHAIRQAYANAHPDTT